ncbi:alanyl-tRNA editing protein [Mogibacterium diversum]|uniref:alanyl-tRNA editing protein n=1 Tax=Mogibacterium diversum TaxID=114527 RepID=UPI0026E99BFE|nr:alanine--tRNA ligase-related protein [Mogibacterium diversum]
MTTEKVFHNDQYLKTLEATITDIVISKERTEIITDRTIFFAEGGGQPGDRGTIHLSDDNSKIVTIFDTHDSGDAVAHYTNDKVPFTVGDKVTLELDWTFRFTNMQRHYGEHILSGAIYKLYKGANKGFHMGKNYITIDIDLGGELMTEEMLSESELLANEAVWKNLPIQAHHFDSVESANYMPLRKAVNEKVDGNVVIVTVGNPDDPFDCCACCGTYPSFSGEVGVIKMFKAEPNKGMTRIYFDCGRNALLHYRESHKILTEVAEKFSSKPENLMHAIAKKDKEEAELKAKRASLAEYVRNFEAEAIARSHEVGMKFIYKEYDNISPNDLQKLGFKALEMIDGEKPLLALANSPSHTLMLVSDGNYPCGTLVKEHAKNFGGKGGGRDDNARAQFDSRYGLESFVEVIKQNL